MELTSLNNFNSEEINAILHEAALESNLQITSNPTNISIANLLTHEYGIKSGSTNTDNWIIGFNNEIVSSIWIGYDDNKNMTNNDFKYSKKIWANAIESYLKDKEISWYSIPDNVVGVIVDPITGNIANDD